MPLDDQESVCTTKANENNKNKEVRKHGGFRLGKDAGESGLDNATLSSGWHHV